MSKRRQLSRTVLLKCAFAQALGFALGENTDTLTVTHFFQDTAMSKVWFKQDDKFFLPKACLNFEFFRCVANGEPLCGNFDSAPLAQRQKLDFFYDTGNKLC